MQYTRLPQTDLTVSKLAFGNFTVGVNWWGDFTDDQAVRLHLDCFEAGINFFDSAPAYGNGRAEAMLGRALKEGLSRPDVVIATKFGYDFYRDPGEQGSHRERQQDFSPKAVRFELEQSLKRLGTDRVDLYQAHNLKLPQMSDDLFATLEDLKDEGKLLSWGVALGPAIGWREEGYTSFQKRHAAVVQTVMNLYEQDPGREFCELATMLNQATQPATPSAGVIARVPTNSGILDEEFKSPDHVFDQKDHRKFRDRDWLVFGLKKNDMIRPLAEQLGCSVRHLAIKWLNQQPGLVAIEPNILTKADAIDHARAFEGRDIPEQTMAQLADWYATDFNLGDGAHPCDHKSSTSDTGAVRSEYLGPVGAAAPELSSRA